MNLKRVEMFRNAVSGCAELQDKRPGNPAVISILAQLEYLIAVETGENPDRTRLKDIIIGVLAAREIEPLDMKLAEQLHGVAGEVRLMTFGRD